MIELEWRTIDGERRSFYQNQEIVWAAQPGSQKAFLECPIFEALIEGSRGGGKTDTLLMDFAQHCGRGFGPEWRGILFRRTFAQLEDVVAKTRKWFRRIFPLAGFNQSSMTWTFPGGEILRFAYMDREDDYWNYHGHSYTWIGWEELTTWADDKCYKIMMSCCRSTHHAIPRKYRATTNPYGPGHNWVKARWKLPVPPGRRIGEIHGDPQRVAIHSHLDENLALMVADPQYKTRIESAARNPSERKAWVEGSWDIVAGGMIDDVWKPETHVIEPFLIPDGWRINRSYDHGQSHPFSVGWWAESNGEPAVSGDRVFGTVPGDTFRIAEWYGWNGQPNEGLRLSSSEIADGIRDRENRWGLSGRVRMGPADSSIFDEFQPGTSIAGEMMKRGIHWTKADKRPGSRKHGWEKIREMLRAAVPGAEGVREAPGLFIFSTCDQFIRTVPVLPRDDRDPDDVDTDAEDHVGDETRYRLRDKIREVTVSDG